MKDQEIKINNEKPITDGVAKTAEPIVAAAAATVVGTPSSPAASANKITPGRRMRDSARKGGHGMGMGSSAGGNRNVRGKGGSRGGDNRERVKPEFDSKMIDIRRVTRVAAGGRRYSFSVAVVAGDRKGRVGVGLGKGIDTSLAIEKATREAKKRLIKVPLSSKMTIPHAIEAKYGSAIIKIFPARGSGIVAGSSARNVIELAGIKDVCAKIMSGSKNKINIARAAILALSKLSKISRSALNPKKE
ncbi:MAG: 30S ribosomal protein S5 [Candidatus Taylorbacteria bacterium]|nr:30S ribosomal protein S5 [Candidatus Taylorbacteria bacterium]